MKGDRGSQSLPFYRFHNALLPQITGLAVSLDNFVDSAIFRLLAPPVSFWAFQWLLATLWVVVAVVALANRGQFTQPRRRRQVA